jgi:hypothetical protein
MAREVEMRLGMLVALVATMQGCGEGNVDEAPATPEGDTDTDADGDADVDTAGDTSADIDTGTPPERTPGCAPQVAAIPVDYGGCTSVTTYSSPRPYLTETRSFDADGRVATLSVIDTTPGYEVNELHTYTYEEHDLVAQDLVDVDQDGSVDRTDTYALTFDASDRLTRSDDVTTDASDAVVAEYIVEQTWGSCGIELEQDDSDGDGVVDDTFTTAFFTDGWAREADVSAPRSDYRESQFVDPVTGQYERLTEEFDAGHPGPDMVYDWVSFDGDGRPLELDGSYWLDPLDSDLKVVLAYDAGGRESLYHLTLESGAMVLYDFTESTDWECP